MSTTITPPPPVPPTGGYAPQPPQPRSTSRVIAILAICLGAVLILGAITTAAFSAIRAAAVSTGTLTADATGITELDIDVDAAGFRLAYGGDEASLEVTGGSGSSAWRLDRDGDTLRVHSTRPWWGGWNWWGDDERVVLTLPDRYEDTPLDASFDLGAGSITADGTYRELELDLGAGAMDITGVAEHVDAEISAGRASLDLDEVDTATLSISAGSMDGELRGPVTALDLDVSAGRMVLTIPDQTYNLDQDVSAGDLTHDLDTSSSSRNTITASVSAGSIDLRPAR
ncbi:DUF4097 family beta strand repeat-containing protein [Microbacterium invictum]|uniref:DUF4097 domain-containing protein n=1 Tax=Microbacterium invictum TaxID=515415 RepID=A0AA40SLC2_9MICO|nr:MULTISPECIES: DUF4097 family beta strand repeat-containing protein [Microbacterium]MBB4138225.1 hypothetical protein [Microbacterium invictum]